MAEERNVGTARAPELTNPGGEPTKEELQRRMEEARESISQTVNDIKETVTTQYETVKETISQTFDWREQYRRRPIALSVGAVGVGFVLGYRIGGAFTGGEDDLAGRYYEAEGEDGEEGAARQPFHAAQAITGGAYGSSAYAPAAQPSIEEARAAYERGMERQLAQGTGQPAKEDHGAASPSADGASASRPSYSSGYESSPAEAEPEKPGLISRFKETQAYDRLQEEVSKLGSRAVEELSKTAQNVVLPALLSKLKDMIGIDLSTQREVAQRSRLEHQSAAAHTAADRSASGATTGATADAGSQSAGSGGYGKTL